MTLESSRILGGIAALLMVISSVSSFLSLAQFAFPNLVFGIIEAPFGFLGLAGLILFMVAMWGFSAHYKDHGIFNNALYWILTSIIGGIVAALLAVAVMFSVLSQIIEVMTPFTSANPPTLNAVLDALRPFIGYFIPVGVVAFAIGVVGVVFVMRAFNKLAAATGVPLFRTVSLLFLVGIAVTGAVGLLAILLVTFDALSITAILPLIAVSGLVSLAQWSLATVAFFRITAPMPLTQQAPVLSTGQVQVKYWPHCGTQNRADAEYCVHCGTRF